jgi:hypothetical protein
MSEQRDGPGESKAERAKEAPPTAPMEPGKPKEIGGRKGPDPTRYGDWEINGRCVDF